MDLVVVADVGVILVRTILEIKSFCIVYICLGH